MNANKCRYASTQKYAYAYSKTPEIQWKASVVVRIQADSNYLINLQGILVLSERENTKFIRRIVEINKFCQIMKIERNFCSPCRKRGIKTITKQKHLEEVHEIKVFGYQRLWEEIRDYFIQKKKEISKEPLKRLKREALKKKWDNLMQEILEDTKKELEEFGQHDSL